MPSFHGLHRSLNFCNLIW